MSKICDRNYSEGSMYTVKQIDGVGCCPSCEQPTQCHGKPVEVRALFWSLAGETGISSKAKQAITSLIKDLVAEAKPRHLSDINGYHEEFTPDQLTRITAANRASNEAVKEFEQNLLKALEEV